MNNVRLMLSERSELESVDKVFQTLRCFHVFHTAAGQNPIQHWHLYVGAAAAVIVAVVAAVVIGWKIKRKRSESAKERFPHSNRFIQLTCVEVEGF